MAQDTELGAGQLNPSAQPVNAFIQPSDYQVAQPGAVVQIPGVQQLNVINTPGSPYVAGANNSAILADALRPFSKAVMETSEQAGLQYASWQMQKGEAAFMAAYRKAQLAVDQSTEVAETERAQATRAVAAKDPAAGQLMWMLNPYFQMGTQRARSRLAAQEITGGMPGYVASQGGRIDYESPDQGFGALQSIRAEYISQVTQKYGVSEESPGFQKYTAPAIEKASEREATRLQEDRVKYFEEMRPKQLAELLRNEMIAHVTKAIPVELDGNTYKYNQNGDNQLYWLAFGKKLNNMARDFLQKAGPGGMASKWQREAYEILMADANFKDDATMRRLIGQLTTSTPLRGADGKPVKNANGEEVYLTWDQLYSKERIDSQIKYEQAGFNARQAQAKDFGVRAEAAIAAATEGMTPGPERFNTGLAALERFIQEERQRTGQPVTALQRLEARKGWKDANTLTDQLVFEQDDPGQQTRFFADLGQRFGSTFNAAQARSQATAIAAGMRNQEEARQFLTQAYAEISRKEKEVQDFSGYTSARDKVINDNITARNLRNYPDQSKNSESDRKEATRRQRQAYTSHVNERIREREAQLGRKLTETEVRAVAQKALDEYGKGDKDALQYLFPGSPAYPNSPSVDPYYRVKPQQLGPDGKPVNPNAYKGSVYETNQLDDIPNRAVVLRQYKKIPVLSLEAIRDVTFAARDGKPRSMKFERAWRDANAPTALDFIRAQLEFYPNYKPEFTDQELKTIWKNLQAAAARENNSIAVAALRQSMPMLASIAASSDGFGDVS